MPTDHSNMTKEPCTHCGKEYYPIYMDKHLKSCKVKKACHHLKCGSENELYVRCPICNRSLKEINTAHLKFHNLTIPEFKKLYPNYDTISKNSRAAKNTLGGDKLTKEISENLRFGHTLEGRIARHGERLGLKIHEQSRINYSESKTLDGLIDRFGEKVGRDKYEANKLRFEKSVSGTRGKTNSLSYYKKRFGEKEGILKWNARSRKNSISSRKHIGKAEEFKKYKSEVDTVTKFFVNNFPIPDIHKRSKHMHLDHKVSKLHGWNNSICPYMIGFYGNLEMIDSGLNMSKGIKCSMSAEDLKSISNSNYLFRFIQRYNLLSLDTAKDFSFDSLNTEGIVIAFLEFIFVSSLLSGVTIPNRLHSRVKNLTTVELVCPNINNDKILSIFRKICDISTGVELLSSIEFIRKVNSDLYYYIFKESGLNLMPKLTINN